MVDFRTVITLILIAITISEATHHPKVYEENEENSRNEKIRTARNPEATYRTVYRPPVFNFQTAKQQDYLKFRYAEQQRANALNMVNGIASHKYQQPQQILYQVSPTVQHNADDWQPFDPVTHQIDLQRVHQQKTIEDFKQYSPVLLKAPVPKNVQLSFLDTRINIPRTLRSSPNFTISTNDDLASQGSEIVEDKVDYKRSDTPNKYTEVIYLRPKELQEHIRQNSDGKSIQEDADTSNKKPGVELNALNDLLGKNPNIQLEGLKRLLETNPSMNYNVPRAQEADQYQSKEHDPISEKMIDVSNTQTSIQINHEDNTITLPSGHIVDKGSLEDIQKQLDEESKIHVQQVLARAQQEAQAQVEAQHKAIALAQVRAQKVALENIKKSIYGSPEALPLTMNNQEIQQDDGEQYDAAINTHSQENSSPEINVVPILTNNFVPAASHTNPNQPDKIELPISSALKRVNPQIVRNSHITPITQTSLYQNVAPQNYGSKELLYYAPHHHNEDLTHVQAENSLLNTFKPQNNDLFRNHQNAPSTIQQILKTEQISHGEGQDHSNLHTATPIPETIAYQHIRLESKEIENTAAEQKDYDDHDDLQYAAKYAFGYRIKDTKEGNDFGHEERRDGKSLEGSYHVLLPDGRLQKVQYYADKSGYHAKVTYEHIGH